MQLGNNIQTLRKKKGLSQEKLAEKINVTRQTISNWELGETAPNPEQLILLSKQFDISIDELVGNDAMSSGSSRENKSIKEIKMEKQQLPACPVETTLTLISDKWKVLILRDLLPGTKRFGELKKSIGHVSQKVLTAQLRQMEQSGLLTRTVCLLYTSPSPRDCS